MNTVLWTPTEEWKGQDAFLIGGGPSLKSFDFSVLRGKNVLGCNDAFRLGPDIVKYAVFGDGGWFHRFYSEFDKSPLVFVTNCLSVFHITHPRLRKMRRQRDGIHNGDTLGWNFSTGALAINLALSLGVSRIFLLGYDLSMKVGVSHWHQHNTAPITDFTLKRFQKGFETVKNGLPAGVGVFNVTDGSSKLECFEKLSFETFHSLLVEKREEVLA